MSFIAAVRVRVEREGRRGGGEFRKKKRESKGRSKHTLQYVYVCFTLFFLSFPFRQRRSFIFFFCCCVCALQGQQALTSHSLTRVTAHVTFKTKRPSKKNTNKPKNKEDSTLVRPDATQRSRHARERRPDFPSGYVAN